MLVPLETLSGWPQVTNPTPLQVLLLLVGFPLLVFNPGLGASDEAPAGDAEQVPAGDRDVEGDDTGEHVGGAGARW
jgi:hypothetical protein